MTHHGWLSAALLVAWTHTVPGGGWSDAADLLLNGNAATTLKVDSFSSVVISEFMADNANGIKDDDAERSDWIELCNLGPDEVGLEGWFLTDTTTNLTQW